MGWMGEEGLHRAWADVAVRHGFDWLFLIKDNSDSIYEVLPGFRALYFAWVSTFNLHHLPHFANEGEGREPWSLRSQS